MGVQGGAGLARPAEPRWATESLIDRRGGVAVFGGAIGGRMPSRKGRKSAWDVGPGRIASAEAVLRESRRLLRDPARVLAMVAEGRPVKLPLRTDLGVMAALFEAIRRGITTRPRSGPTPTPCANGSSSAGPRRNRLER